MTNTYLLPRFRFVPRVSFHADTAGALSSARILAWQVSRHEQLIRPGGPAETSPSAARRSCSPSPTAGGGSRLRYRAEEGGGLFVAAMTFDPGWRALLDGAPLAIYPTAACQLGLRLPAGEHRLELRYHDPLLGPGALVTLLALAAGGDLLLLRPVTGRRRHLA